MVAITFDDLPAPVPGVVSNQPAAVLEMTRRLVEKITAAGVPAVGFVNEGKLYVTPNAAEARTDALRVWTAAGLELGNHTYSHSGLQRTILSEMQHDVVRGEEVTRKLLEGRGRKLRYFRHPYLQVGPDLRARRLFEEFLERQGYTVAPVTIDNGDYIFAAAYARALRRKNTDEAKKLADAYVEYMGTMVEFFESVSQEVAGREIRHVLLLHANQINADHFDRIAELFAKRGYRFVSLEEALEDPIYQSPDTYTGAWGISWLHHWALTAGKRRRPDPDPPEWVMELYNLAAEERN